MKKLSDPQIRVLKNLFHGLHISSGLTRQCEYGGMEATVRSLVRKGLITWEHELTEEGKVVAASLQEKKQ